MTRQEILNTPEIVDFMIDKSVMVDSKIKLHKRLEELCKLAIKALEQQSCEDAISREAVKETIFIQGSVEKLEIDFAKLLLLQRAIKALPSVTPKQKAGHWIDIQYFKADDTYYRPKCPFCGIEPKEYSNYCPECGARMEAETKIEQGLNFADQDTMMPAT